MGKVIIVEDSLSYLEYVSGFLKSKGWETATTMSRKGAMQLIGEADDEDIILSDMRLGDGEVTDLLEWMRKGNIHNPVIVMTRYFETPSAINALKLGAKDFIDKTTLEVNLPPLLKSIRKELSERYRTHEPIFNRQSEAYQNVLEKVRLVAATDMSVLITGESGTGKEHIARKIHEQSQRHGKPFGKVDCGTLDENLAKSTLFGHEKGAFTGAEKRHRGLFETVDGGTLFLDEIGNLSLSVQQMLLRALQEKTFRPIGAEKDLKADIRIVAATNEDLDKAVGEGRFRADLLYRLRVFPIQMPTLTECREDIMPLAEFFREKNKGEKKLKGFSDDAKKALTEHYWQGNVRELKNVIERAVVYAKGDEITAADIVFDCVAQANGKTLRLNDPEMEKRKIMDALDKTDGNISEAVAELGIGRTTLYTKMAIYGIDAKEWRKRKR